MEVNTVKLKIGEFDFQQKGKMLTFKWKNIKEV